jgi:hypothetical protein
MARPKLSAEQLIRGILGKRDDWYTTSTIGVMVGNRLSREKRKEVLADMIHRGEVKVRSEKRRGREVLFYKLVR